MKQAMNTNFMFTSKASKEAKIRNSVAGSQLETELKHIERLKKAQLNQIEAAHKGFKTKVRKNRFKRLKKKQAQDKSRGGQSDVLKLPDVGDKSSANDEEKDAEEKKDQYNVTQVLILPPILSLNKGDRVLGQTRKSISFESGLNKLANEYSKTQSLGMRRASLRVGGSLPKLESNLPPILSMNKEKKERLGQTRKSVSFDTGLNKLAVDFGATQGLGARRSSLRVDALPKPRTRTNSLHPSVLEDFAKMGATRRKRGSMAVPGSSRSRSSSVDVGFLGLHGSLKERLRSLASLQSVFYDEEDEEDRPDSALGHLFEEIKNCRYLRLPPTNSDHEEDVF